jgi:transcription-repair coupling factor (superfamily II helicase)
MEGKQVAILVPTTVLAAQHYNTFRERFAPYPVKVEMLSRFRSAKEQTRIIAELAVGALDLVVGTHRLLSKDVVFKDLGLLVVDEEQRFGVRHKERIKQLRVNVDVLTLTATPIPRTLHMAMSGLREMSLINDPPEGRRPVHTQASPRSDALITEAVLRELERGGQVYYVHNRVESIPHVVAHLQRIVPRARIVAAHGQMTEVKLEKVMVDFYQGKYDILVCTTIIENGLDLPNVNTLIADEADKLGLAQLYQLRGRVGRSERQAYAYLMWTPHKRMSETAQQRIHAIREFSDLGSGLKLALRDLEIRGAGNLLGAEQHGFAAAVGFDLYCQLLAEAVKEERGQAPAPRPEVSLDLPVEAYLPEDWVPSLNQRIELYRRLAAVSAEGTLEDLAAEMRDRFGATFPPPVYNLYRLIRIKLLSRAGRVERISVKQRVLVFQLAEPRLGVLQMRDLRAALALQKDLPKGMQVEPTRILLPLGAEAVADWFLLVEETLGVLGRLV